MWRAPLFLFLRIDDCGIIHKWIHGSPAACHGLPVQNRDPGICRIPSVESENCGYAAPFHYRYVKGIPCREGGVAQNDIFSPVRILPLDRIDFVCDLQYHFESGLDGISAVYSDTTVEYLL